jgi:hypothetical protein
LFSRAIQQILFADSDLALIAHCDQYRLSFLQSVIMALNKPKRVDRESYVLRSGKQLYGDPLKASTQNSSESGQPRNKAFYRIGDDAYDQCEREGDAKGEGGEQW